MKIKIHFITQIYLIVALLSGYFYEVVTMYICLLFHELGHLVMIKLFKKDILLLEISPIGGILHIDRCQNDKNYKEFLIYLSGPIASLMLFIIFKYFNVNQILINSALYVLILNLLPILPLDGAKILMSLKQYVFPLRWVMKIVTLLSIVFCFILIICFINNYNYVIILLFFLYLNLINYKNIPYDYYNFLLFKHFHHNIKLRDKIIVTNKSFYYLFYKGYNNIFFKDNKFTHEKEFLKQIITKQ